ALLHHPWRGGWHRARAGGGEVHHRPAPGEGRDRRGARRGHHRRRGLARRRNVSDRARILVVDDDAGVVELWAEVLSRESYEVVGMTDPTAALARAAEEVFDLVLCDVEMPGMRGPELLE